MSNPGESHLQRDDINIIGVHTLKNVTFLSCLGPAAERPTMFEGPFLWHLSEIQRRWSVKNNSDIDHHLFPSSKVLGQKFWVEERFLPGRFSISCLCGFHKLISNSVVFVWSISSCMKGLAGNLYLTPGYFSTDPGWCPVPWAVGWHLMENSFN